MYERVFALASVAVGTTILVRYLVNIKLRAGFLTAEIQLATRLDVLDERVPVLVQKLRGRGRIILANRIAGAHKRMMYLDELDDHVLRTYRQALVHRVGLAQRLASAYGIP